MMPDRRPGKGADYRITGWGGESSPILLQIEPEFGIEGYRGILAAEIAVLNHKIDDQGVGKDGKKYAHPPLPRPQITHIEAVRREPPPNCAPPAWPNRYPPRRKRRIMQRLLASRPLLWLKNLARRILRNLAWAFAPPMEKMAAPPLPLSQLLEKTDHFICLSEKFWLANKKFIMQFFPTERRTITAQLEAVVEQAECLAVPLRRFNSSSLEGWLRCQNVCAADDFLLVMYAEQAGQAADLLFATGQTQAKVLVIAEELSRDVATRWESTVRIDSRLWLVQGLKTTFPKTNSLSASPENLPRISIVVVSYNQAAYIRDCLESILNQDYPNLECIVVDGQSTDGTNRILEAYRDRLDTLIIEPDRCQSEALNKGFRLTTGDILSWVCSDDMLEKGALFEVAKAFGKYRTDLVAGGCRIINDRGKNICNHQNGFPFSEISRLSFGDLLSFVGVWEKGMYFYQPDVFFSKSIWEESGAYLKEHLHFAMDYDLFLRFAMAGASIVHIPAYLATRRVHDQQKTQHTTMSYLPTIRNLLSEYKILMNGIMEEGKPDRPAVHLENGRPHSRLMAV